MTSNLSHPDQFISRHIGPDEAEVTEMLRVIGAPSLDALIEQTVPSAIRTKRALSISDAAGESELLRYLEAQAGVSRQGIARPAFPSRERLLAREIAPSRFYRRYRRGPAGWLAYVRASLRAADGPIPVAR